MSTSNNTKTPIQTLRALWLTSPTAHDREVLSLLVEARHRRPGPVGCELTYESRLRWLRTELRYERTLHDDGDHRALALLEAIRTLDTPQDGGRA